MKNKRTINVGMFGLGTVGTGVARMILEQGAAIEAKTGVRVMLKKVVVRSPGKKRPLRLAASLLSSDPRQILDDPSIDLVVEVMGGVKPASEYILRSFAAGKHVVTANKALLAERGDEIFAAAALKGRSLGFEASVCGGIPLIKSIREGLAADTISKVFGIVNGTCNYILSSMSQRGVDFKTVLAEAQAAGYAEADPRLDVEGIDSAHKLAILARLAFGASVPFKAISSEGIRTIALTDIEYARELGYTLKLLAIGKRMSGGLELRVHPTLLPADHPLSSVRESYNAVFVHADHAGDLLFYGRGAGMFPTASAVMADIIGIAKASSEAGPSVSREVGSSVMKVLSTDEMRSQYYLRFQVHDRPGVLGQIAQTLGRHHISILSVHQKESHTPNSVPVVILTYEAREADLRRALRVIDARRQTVQRTVVIRVER